jgi:hypothetical protein
MSDFYLKIGDSVKFSKTVSESDVCLFAGITGDVASGTRQATRCRRRCQNVVFPGRRSMATAMYQ